MSNRRFPGRYELEDGYVGGSRTQRFSVGEDELDDDMTENDLRTLFYNMAEEHMHQNIGIAGLNEDEFVEWAQGILNARKAAE